MFSDLLVNPNYDEFNNIRGTRKKLKRNNVLLVDQNYSDTKRVLINKVIHEKKEKTVYCLFFCSV